VGIYPQMIQTYAEEPWSKKNDPQMAQNTTDSARES